jgi:phosphopantothenoylcysteine decarboxylase/phosphopantothenate--cysteine ligase
MNLLLGISGGIAAYKTPELVRALRRRGHTVRCVCTESALRLVAADALVAVSGEPVSCAMFPGDGRMPHIDLARWSQAMVIAPATADILARLSLGLADDLLTTLVLALEPEKPLWLAPAMNTVMWNKPVVQGHVRTLAERGALIIPPVSGHLACGESGVGAMEDPERIANLIVPG